MANNPLKSLSRVYDIALVRHVPVMATTFSSWGLSLPRFDSIPTWKYAAPHTLRRWTPQTDSANFALGGTCSDRCHGSGYYLQEADFNRADRGLTNSELPANQRFIIGD